MDPLKRLVRVNFLYVFGLAFSEFLFSILNLIYRNGPTACGDLVEAGPLKDFALARLAQGSSGLATLLFLFVCGLVSVNLSLRQGSSSLKIFGIACALLVILLEALRIFGAPGEAFFC